MHRCGIVLAFVSSVLLAGSATAADQASNMSKKKIVFMAGPQSHGYGAHEHYAGCMLLARCLEEGLPNVETVVYRNGWPKDPAAFDGADTVVMYCDGGGGHPVNAHLEQLDALAKKGVGVVCIHYGVEVLAQPAGVKFLDWIGGYFEANWSVNPHWTANYKEFPMHPITRGVEPFTMNDEWYYHMRFRDGMQGVTPILTDLPPKDTLNRPDGDHSGNPAVREAIAKGEPQHMAWAAERPDGGRGFGFTGGHDHWNWGNPNFRKLMLNAIAWTAKVDVPDNGVVDKGVTLEDLLANQDEPQPNNLNFDDIRKRASLPAAKDGAQKLPSGKVPGGKPIASTKVITSQTPGHAEEIEADITGAKQLFLVVNDGGNGFGCDWADWAEPRLVGPAGDKPLTELKWTSARSEWGNVNVNKNAEGRPLRIAGQSVEYGIGTHANSLIAFDLPEGYTNFKARCGLDNGGTDQGGGGQGTSVQFQVFTTRPAEFVSTSGGRGATSGSHEADDAVAGLDVADGLAATLFAAEPLLLNPTNIDIDQLGRVWVCEVLNYRRFANNQFPERMEGDRILILEDTDGNGQLDKQTVFYQGRDADSAHGVCVLPTPSGKGTRAIVSAGDRVFYLIDDDGDLKADRKELIFTGISGTQHDHGIHKFMFGPDGKLYFNFGNAGERLKDKDGKPVVDLAGNVVGEHRHPYQQGMVFRCDPDGSNVETLAWNFRNNWMVTVDSFGTLWQSDNDDDGNRGVRINYVMEFGNYGYHDEITGAAWNTPRTNLETEIPLRHWHLNDPGVVPNLLQTGAGSPTGICVYEGTLLPEIFRNQIIHCDAGPNVVRAYPVKDDGAGYSAESVNILYGARDNWFRPSDVQVAPDGSLIVADWYDPGVGGHRMGDVEHGRLFRVAPPDAPYKFPQVDVSTSAGAIEALQSPNSATRYLAWTALHELGAQAEPALKEVFTNASDPRLRARALWLLGRIADRGPAYIEAAIRDASPDIRIVGVRLARELNLDVIPVAQTLASDPSPQVRRDCAIALRHNPSPEAPQLWAELAARHDGQDRWYLEALGIGADKQWDAFFDAWLTVVGDNWNTPAGRDIIWRSRATKTPQYLVQIVQDASLSVDDLPRYLRAFDFLDGSAKDAALVELAFSTDGDDARQKFVTTESLQRLKGFDVKSHAAALNKALDGLRGTSQFVALVDKYNVAARYPELLALAQTDSDGQVGVEAIRVLLAKDQRDLIAASVAGQDLVKAIATVRALGNSADNRATGMLVPLVKETRWDAELRRQATRGAAQTTAGARALIQLASAGELDEGLKSAAAFSLNSSPLDDVRAAAEKLFPLPEAKNNSLPPIGELLKAKGDANHGKVVFATTSECAKCHVVNNEGKEVGPNLSEIGSKLSRQAMFESIIYPSAGISHSYETHALVLDSGNVVTGILVSETDDSVTVKSNDAIIRTFPRAEIEEMRKLPISLMPADLQKTMTVQDLVDVVGYLETLKKPE